MITTIAFVFFASQTQKCSEVKTTFHGHFSKDCGVGAEKSIWLAHTTKTNVHSVVQNAHCITWNKQTKSILFQLFFSHAILEPISHGRVRCVENEDREMEIFSREKADTFVALMGLLRRVKWNGAFNVVPNDFRYFTFSLIQGPMLCVSVCVCSLQCTFFLSQNLLFFFSVQVDSHRNHRQGKMKKKTQPSNN